MNIIDLFVIANEINLGELVNYIQKHIILNQERVEKNMIKMFSILSRHQGVFNILCEYFEELISNNPKILFNNSNLFSGLGKDALLSLIQSDYFPMEEIKIWNNLLKWTVTNNPTINNDTSF